MRRLKSILTAKTLLKTICLLITVGILCILPERQVHASSEGLTGQTGNSTVIEQQGESENPEDIQELNIANTVTIEYNNGNGQLNGALRILIILTLIAIAPILLICLTSFTRIIMTPTFTEIYAEAYVPFEAGELTQEEALTEAIEPIRQFMYNETQRKDVELFMSIARQDWNGELEDIPITVLIPSFIISELRTAFFIGFLIYIPFIVIDMVVASALMAMGMMMLPPTTISMPFKILLFVLADGWGLIIGSLMNTFHYG